jgi:aspartyl protease family protein
MGHVRVPIILANAEHRDLSVEVPDALVDTGATWTTIPRKLADELQLPSIGEVTGRTAGGIQTLDQSYCYFELQGKSGVGPLLISDMVDIVLIGALTLESAALAVDPSSGRLVETELYLL